MIVSLSMNNPILSPNIVLEEIKAQGLKHPEIVLRQSILETGWYKCTDCALDVNNLFGLWDSRNQKYFEYNSLKESIIGYKKMIQDPYYKEGDYYEFLECMWKGDTGDCKRYASSKNYTETLKRIRL